MNGCEGSIPDICFEGSEAEEAAATVAVGGTCADSVEEDASDEAGTSEC